MDNLERYWSGIFPYVWKHALEPLLTCNGKYAIERLELIPRWVKEDGQSIMARHVVFRTSDELFTYLVKHKPATLQLGGIFPMITQEYANRDADWDLIRGGVCSAEGPLKIDLDINDYDRTGVCNCIKTETCVKCWDECMHSARLIIDFILRNVFCMTKIFHFWSGNRGLHMWCFDERVFAWTKAERTNFLNVIKNRAALEHLLPDNLKALRFWPAFDDKVTTDPTHALGLPFGPHHITECIRTHMAPLSFKEKFDPKHHRMFSTLDKIVIGDLKDPIYYIKTA